ncbi:MAG: DUF4192 domain-containing protein [Nocardioides sp.]|uniref:DUF4192 domain-containing protein n=1 Tax=Nocardioides sp. TaxID=35761 RepID=UPI0039E287F2
MLTMKAKTPEDILAAVPVVLGFHPRDSVVMLTFGGAHAFHARIDMPPPAPPPAVVEGLASALLTPVFRERAEAVVLVLYSADAALAEEVFEHLAARCGEGGVRVLEGLRVHGDRWFPIASPAAGPPDGVPFDLGSHRFTAASVLEGLVTAESREQIAARVAADPPGVEAVAEALPASGLMTGPRLRDLLEAHAAAGTVPDDDQAASILRSIAGPSVRDHAWWAVGRRSAEAHAALWTDLVRRAPAPLLGHAAGVLAMVAWQAGQGTLAWCAVDRGREVAPAHSLLRLASDILGAGTPPFDDWPADALPLTG